VPKPRVGKVEVQLTEKQRRFAAEFPVDLCGAKAAVRAGYSRRTADRIASRLLRHPGVAAILAKHAARVGEQLDLTVERLEAELARCAFLDPRRLFGEGGRMLEVHELDEDTARAVASVKVRVAKVTTGDDAAGLAKSLGVETPEGRKVEKVELGTVELKFNSKVEAISLSLKRLGALVERVQAVHSVIPDDITNEEWALAAAMVHGVRPDIGERVSQGLHHGQPVAPPTGAGGPRREAS
jgi:phage terminase small subunit